MRFATIIAALLTTACVSAVPSVYPLSDGTAVERHVLQFHQDLAALNASVGDAPIIYSLERASDLQTYQRAIRRRIGRDLRNEYPSGVRPATQTFLLLGATTTHDVVQLVRLGSTSPNGQLERLEGLTYVFDRTTGRLLGVMGTEY